VADLDLDSLPAVAHRDHERVPGLCIWDEGS
jgi:hypothetical protein